MVVPGLPHHVTQRGDRRMDTFFSDADHLAYFSLLAEWCGRCGVRIWAYYLMLNHVHLIVAPGGEEGLCRGIGDPYLLATRDRLLVRPSVP